MSIFPPEPPPGGPVIESAMTFDDVCIARNITCHLAGRERGAGIWPEPDFFVGVGRTKSPRWHRSTIERWLGIVRPPDSSNPGTWRIWCLDVYFKALTQGDKCLAAAAARELGIAAEEKRPDPPLVREEAPR